jgi:hypothetical protein
MHEGTGIEQSCKEGRHTPQAGRLAARLPRVGLERRLALRARRLPRGAGGQVLLLHGLRATQLPGGFLRRCRRARARALRTRHLPCRESRSIMRP